MAKARIDPDAKDREELIDTLIAISVVAKRLANMLREEGEKENEQDERTVPDAG